MPTYTDTTSIQGYTLTLELDLVSQNVENNTSYIGWELRLTKPSGQNDYVLEPAAWKVTLAGQSSNGSKTYDFRNYTTLVLGAGAKTIPHGSAGTKTLNLSATFTEDSSAINIGNASISDSWTLPTISRESVATFSDSNIELLEPVTIYTNRESSAFTHTISYTFGTRQNTIATDVTTSVTWTPQLFMLDQMTSSTSGAVTVTTKTYNGSTLIGTTNKTLTVRAPANIVPAITGVTHSENVTAVSTAIGAYVQNNTKLNLAITGAAGVYDSTIVSRKIVVDGQTINATSGVTGVITTSGTVNIVATVTDSRGRSNSVTVPITVLAWVPPTNTVFTLQRAISSGSPSEAGTYIRVNHTETVQSLIVGGVQKNALTYKVSTRVRGTTPWTLKAGPTVSGLSFSGNTLLSPYAADTSFEVLLEVSDKLATAAYQGTVATEFVLMHWAATGIGIGKFWTQGALDVAGDIYANQVILTAAPTLGGHAVTKTYADTIGANAKVAHLHRGRDVNVAIPTATFTTVNYNVAISSTAGNGSSIGISGSNFTAPFTGIYAIHASAGFVAGATGQRILRLMVNGVNRAESTRQLPSASWATAVKVDIEILLTAGDEFHIECYQSNGANLNMGVGQEMTYITITGTRV